jgi:hypothetical protein
MVNNLSKEYKIEEKIWEDIYEISFNTKNFWVLRRCQSSTVKIDESTSLIKKIPLTLKWIEEYISIFN